MKKKKKSNALTFFCVFSVLCDQIAMMEMKTAEGLVQKDRGVCVCVCVCECVPVCLSVSVCVLGVRGLLGYLVLSIFLFN